MKDRILVVDDEKEIADLVAFYLESETFEVVTCYSAETALQNVSEKEFDLAILDIMLPGTSGFEICRTIRESHNYPVIMLTAKDEEIDKIRGLTLGADDYMTKPFSPRVLLAASEDAGMGWPRVGCLGGGHVSMTHSAHIK